MDQNIHNNYDTYKNPSTRGHIRSASLENANSFILKNTLGLPLIGPGTTGTLKSRNEQKRLKNRFGSHSNLDDYVAQSKSKFQNLRNMFETKLDYEQQQQQQQQQQQSPHHHHRHISPHNLNQMNQNIKLNPPTYTHHQQQQQQYFHHMSQQQQQIQQTIEFNESLSIVETDRIVGHNNNNNLRNHHNHHQSNNCAENSEQSKNVLRPIAFKPIPFEPDYSIPNRYSELCDRYGSTPSLAPIQGTNMKFGSTSDLRHGYNSYCNTLMARRRCSRSLKINDSMESVRHTPDSDANSQNSTIKSSNKFHQDQFDMTPSPSDSGISELEAALKDRDSELSYLRQTMEHNEKVIFKVHKDKEAYWEQETKKLKIFYESQQREYLLKIKKMEQMLTLQSFQFKQNKLRLSENSNRIKEQISDLKNENDLLRSETEGLKTTERTMKDRVNQLEEKISVMDKLIMNLKTQLEENEWTVCQKNGEIALLKTQLKEATVELTIKEHEIVHIKTEHQSEVQNQTVSSEIEDNHNLEVSQLNRIIILKDQVILALTNELGKLRKELSDLAILHEYGEEPTGKYSRLKYKIDNLSGICNETTMKRNLQNSSDNLITNHNNEIYTNNNDSMEKLITKNGLEENDLEIIINCLKSGTLLDKNNDNIQNIDKHNHHHHHHELSSLLYNQANLPDVTKNSIDIIIDDSGGGNMTDNGSDNVDGKMSTYDENNCIQRELEEAKKTFEIEKRRWSEEKEKVLTYQRQLQMHYINIYQKMKELENQN